MRVLFAGGGTAGHINPALAVADLLKTKDPQTEILFIGTEKGLEADLVPRAGYAFETVPSQGLKRKLSFENIRALGRTLAGVGRARRIIADFKPQIVVGMGGYVCVPVVLAASMKRVPIVLHEQNAIPGLANRWLARFASCMALTYQEAARYLPKAKRHVVVGLPLRQEIMRCSRREGQEYLGLDDQATVVLVTGGSRGGRSINLAVVEAMSEIAELPKLVLVHITGQKTYDETKQAYAAKGISVFPRGPVIIKEFEYDMPRALAAAHLVIARCGANTLAEITARALPSVLIPYPYATNNHQEYNARAMTASGAAVLILDADLTGIKLAKAVLDCLSDPQQYRQRVEAARLMARVDAADRFASLLRELASIK